MKASLRAGRLRTNVRDLVMTTVMGEVAHPGDKTSPYRIGQDGVPRILPGTGGVVINHRIGDPCIGLVGDHIEPGASIKNYRVSPGKNKQAFNLALNTYACVGNKALVVSGACKGAAGVVTGKHGGVDHVLVDFPRRVLERLQIGDRIQVYACGTGLKLEDYPEVELFNCAPRVLRRWGILDDHGQLHVPVTHQLPARVMGSGLGKSTVQRGDYDIQLFDRDFMRGYRLDRLRFGDFVAIRNADTRFGRSFQRGVTTVGVIVHGDSTVSGHGPGFVALLCGPDAYLRAIRDADANLANVLGVRVAKPAVARVPLMERELKRTRRAGVRPVVPASHRRTGGVQS